MQLASDSDGSPGLLLDCRHRSGFIVGKGWRCQSPLLHKHHVTAEACAACEVRDLDSRPPPSGPGTELKRLLSTLGITAGTGCGCDSKAAEMDRNGPAWCREHRAEIVSWLAEARAEAGWLVTLRAAPAAIAMGVNALDTLGWLVEEAIRRAEAARSSSA